MGGASGGGAGLSIARGMIPALSKKFEPKNCRLVARSHLHHHADVGRHVARGETDKDPGQPEAAGPAAGTISFS